MRLVSIASGSSGNCILIDNDNTHILVDAGISRKRISDGLNEIGLTLSDIDGIVITHEHIDHIQGIGVISRKDGIPIYGTAGTVAGIKGCSSIGKVDDALLNIIPTDIEFSIGDISVNPFRTFHDANEPCAYTFTYDGRKASVITDTGTYDDYIVEKLLGSNALLIEANHDINMLQVGPYPYKLKQRILSDYGHMSNDTCTNLLGRILSDDVKGVLLGHLSKENNFDELAMVTVRMGVDMNETPYKASDFDIRIASRDQLTRMAEF